MVISIIIIPVLSSCGTTQQEQVESKDAQFYTNRGAPSVANIFNFMRSSAEVVILEYFPTMQHFKRKCLTYYSFFHIFNSPQNNFLLQESNCRGLCQD